MEGILPEWKYIYCKIMTNIWGNQAKKNIIKAEIKQWGQNLTREEAQAIERARERCENVEEHGCTYVRNEDDEPSSDEDEEAERSDDNESDTEPKADHLYDLVKEYEE